MSAPQRKPALSSEVAQQSESVFALLEETKLRFAKLSGGIVDKIDALGNRVADLEGGLWSR